MTIKLKTAEVAASADGGSITGYASTWTREPDSWGDVVAKGAFAGSIARIAEEGRVLPLLWNHDSGDLKSYIGTVTSLAEDDHGLLFTAAFDQTPEAQRARELAMSGRLCKFSFAYDVLDQLEVELEDGRKANELRELDIHEVSLVMYPANPDTSVVEVKGAPAAKAGRRNSKADEDELRRAIAACEGMVSKLGGFYKDLMDTVNEITESIHGVLGDELADEGNQADADDQGATAEGGEGEATPKGREVDEATKVEAYRNAILKQKEGNHA